MSDLSQQYPDIARQLDATAEYINTYVEYRAKDGRAMVAVVQRGEDGGGSLFALDGGSASLIYSDTITIRTDADR